MVAAVEPIAIIGFANRFPDEASTTEGLWRFLLKARSGFSGFPEGRIGAGHYHPDPNHRGTHAVQGGHFLAEDPALFDAPFFNITKNEVAALDPQQRLVLENVYHALENSGIRMSDVAGSETSVYVSGFNHDHLLNLSADPEVHLKYRGTGTLNSLLSNRVSWFYDFKGPSMTLDTACSSSMVALHLACQSLRSGESSLSVVSGVMNIGYPSDLVCMSHQGFLGQSGKSFSFDHRAQGYARGEGVGSLVVKRLSDAIRDGNTIRAVIRATGVNQDGRTPGITLPSTEAQVNLIRKVYESAGLDVRATMMVESHGTGTAAGDPIEAAALARSFEKRCKEIPLFVGALKSGIGHLEGAAGVAGLIKAILVLESGIIPPNVNFEKPNPRIPVSKWNLQFPLEPTPWPTKGLRRISVNSFGVGGTNGHAVLDDAYHYLESQGTKANHNTRPDVPTSEDIQALVRTASDENAPAIIDVASSSRPHLHGVVGNGINGHAHDQPSKPNGHASAHGHINGHAGALSNGNIHHVDDPLPKSAPCLVLVSAMDEEGVQRNALRQAKTLQNSVGSDSNILDRFAYTMNHRDIFPWRGFAIGASIKELITSLENSPKPLRVKSAPSLGLVFTGQGAQWHAMGHELMSYSVYRDSLRRAEQYYRTQGATWSLVKELQQPKEQSRLNEPWLAHPACTALQVAVVELLESFGIAPKRVVGHSSGEIAAAFCAGKLTLQSAWKIAYYRGIVSSKKISAKGAMMAVGLPPDKLLSYVEQIKHERPGELTIACFNSPKNCTVSGVEGNIDALQQALERDQIFARKLQVQNAYHSALMQEVADEYLTLLGTLPKPGPNSRASVEFFSSLVGGKMDDENLQATYWVDNLVSPVRFSDAVIGMLAAQGSREQASMKINSASRALSVDLILEIGPHSAMQSATKECCATRSDAASISVLGLLDRRTPELTKALSVLGQLYVRGYPLSLDAVNQVTPGKEPKRLLGLPGYSFNHSDRNVFESRLVKNYRQRKHPRHDLLGAPVADWNQEVPRWRHYFSVDEQPWLKDHQVTNSIILPAVAFLTMALEAVRQITDPSAKIKSYKLRDVSIKRAMVIEDDGAGVETSIALSRVDESSLWSSAVWRRFVISSYNPVADDWIEHCTGYIAVNLDSDDGPIDQGRERSAALASAEEALKYAESRCTTPVDVDAMYDNLVTSGFTFGPSFRNLTEIRRTASRLGEAFASAMVPDIASLMPHEFTHPHLIHPAIFDSMLQLFLQSLLDLEGRNTLSRPLVPTFIKEVWVSADVESVPSHQFLGHGRSKLIAYDKYESDVAWSHASSRRACLHFKGIRATFLDSAESQSTSSRALCHELAWVPHLETLTSASLDDPGLHDEEGTATYRTQIQGFQQASVILVLDALQALGDVPSDSFQGHLQRYYSWMVQIRESFRRDQISGVQQSQILDIMKSTEAKEKLLSQAAATNANGELAVRMGSNIVKVLRQEKQALELMFGEDDVLDRVYEELVQLGNLPTLWTTYLRTISDNKTNLRILEVGAGTGASTVPILEQLSSLSPEGLLTTSRIKTYTFTDVSAGFFEKAKEKFQAYRDIMEFKVMDAEKDVSAQSFELGSYDFVIAQNVIHATSNVQTTLSNVRKLLKPGGRLLLQEGVRQDTFWSPIAFGLLPGWWAGVEPHRQWNPWMPSSKWEETLRGAGFDGVELELMDNQVPDLHTQSIFVCRSAEQTISKRANFAVVTTQQPEDSPSPLLRQLTEYIDQIIAPATCSIFHHLDLADADLQNTICLSIMELEKPVLENATEHEFDNFRQMISTCKGLLWVSGDPVQNPALGMITGISRVTRWERDIENTNLVTLHICDDARSKAKGFDCITRLFQQQFLDDLPESDINGEYLVRDGSILTSRLVDGHGADEYLLSKFSRPKPIIKPLKDAGRPVKLAVAAPGLLDRLEWVTDETYGLPLAETEVEVMTKATGLNFRDLMIAMGEHMASCMGAEASGVVTRVGAGVDNLKVGDRVVYLTTTNGTFQDYGRVDQNFVARIPDNLDYEVAASLLVIYITVIYGLEDTARLAPGEKILIHAAAGGVGQAAVQYALHKGAEVFATVSSPAKRELLMSQYGIAEDHIFSSRDLTFAQGVMRMTNGTGVDVVLNSLSGEALRATWELLAPFGRFIEIGKKDAQANGKITLSPYLRNVVMASVEVPTMVEHRPALIKRLIGDILRLWEDGRIRAPAPVTTMRFSEVEAALRTLQSGKGMGKIVLVPSPDDLVPVAPPQPPLYELHADASYIIGGGLGGIGRSMTIWMAARGAKNIILLSRSGKITQETTETVSTLAKQGCRVEIFKCDVSSKEQLREVLEKCKSTLPPIKGAIQGAMTLEDGMFENMSHASFRKAVLPKVHGSWNLHELLPKDLDFFVMLSSSTGILGNRSQANYAAGNTYQDMLSYHRRSLGLKSATVDLGAVLAVGYIAKNRQRFRGARHMGTVLDALREDEVQAVVEYCMSSDHTHAPAQLITGLSSIAAYNAKGMPAPTYMEYPLFTNLRTASLLSSSGGDASSSSDSSVSVEALLNAAPSLDEAAAVVQAAVVGKLAALLSVPADAVDPQRSVAAAGVDSLVAMEFRAFLSKVVKADVPVLDIMGTMSLAVLSRKVAGLSQAVSLDVQAVKGDVVR
ncbi:iterative type I polyketide synthase [Xylariomycetidae sp. FL2044]|nr:iterative type I polyketide synthase [Xylariomycetidae sp. FL2044]